MLDELLRASTDHGLQPKIDRVFPFLEAAEAFAYLDSAAHIGKIVIRHEA